MSQDYENDKHKSLKITDPSGNESTLCQCGLGCRYGGSGQCKGQVSMLSDTKEHMCEHHEQHGAPNNWYNSVPSSKEGPVQRMLGKKLSNFGGTYKDGEDYTKEDPHYVK